MTDLPRTIEAWSFLVSGYALCHLGILAGFRRTSVRPFSGNRVAVAVVASGLFLIGWKGPYVFRFRGPTWFDVAQELSQSLFFAALALAAVLLIGSFVEYSMRESERHRDAALSVSLERKKLQEMDQFKTQLLNIASHELNTPISALRLQLFLLRDRLMTSSQPGERHAYEVLDRNIARLARLVQETLDVARLQAGTMPLQKGQTPVFELIEEAVETVAPLAQESKVQVEFERPSRPVSVEADPQRLLQVLLNLLTNALKFTPAGGRIVVRVREGPDGVEVAVSDSGTGLTTEQASRLFRPFSQVHDVATHGAGGTGLGLFISRGIVERHGGRIWAESAGPGSGSTFAFSLPGPRPAVTA